MKVWQSEARGSICAEKSLQKKLELPSTRGVHEWQKISDKQRRGKGQMSSRLMLSCSYANAPLPSQRKVRLARSPLSGYKMAAQGCSSGPGWGKRTFFARSPACSCPPTPPPAALGPPTPSCTNGSASPQGASPPALLWGRSPSHTTHPLLSPTAPSPAGGGSHQCQDFLGTPCTPIHLHGHLQEERRWQTPYPKAARLVAAAPRE